MITALSIVAVTAVRGDLPLVSQDLNSKKAYEAARTGVEDYAAHLYSDSLYWTKCAGVPEPNAVNLKGSTAKRRAVPANRARPTRSNSSRRAARRPTRNARSPLPGPSMLETTGPAAGSFRVRVTGYSGESSVPIVVNFKRPSFLDYVYFTQLETLDPIAYGFANPSTQLTGAYSQCELTYEQGRQNQNYPGNQPTLRNDLRSSPTTDQGPDAHQRQILDLRHPAVRPHDSGHGRDGRQNPRLVQQRVQRQPHLQRHPLWPRAPILVPPESNSKLSSIALPQFRYTGQVRICLSGNNMTVGTGGGCEGTYSGSIPSNGVVYVKNGACSSVYSPFNDQIRTNPRTGLRQRLRQGHLHRAADDRGGERRDHRRRPLPHHLRARRRRAARPDRQQLRPRLPPVLDRPNGDQRRQRTGSLDDRTIDAAILALNHSFIVDNYNCGAALGNAHRRRRDRPEVPRPGRHRQRRRAAPATSRTTTTTTGSATSSRRASSNPPGPPG